MQLVIFSDLHVHAFPEFGAESRLQDCISVLSDIRAYCIANGVKHVIFGGDLFHKRGVIYTRLYVQVANELLAFRDAGIAFYAVDGNHDHEDSEGTTHALQPLMAGKLICGIGRKGFRVIKVGGVCITLFAYCDSRDVLASRLKAVRQRLKIESRRHIGVFHHGFKGARVGSVLEYEVKEPIDARKLRLDKFFGLVLSGHYHTHQPIDGIRNGWYIGSPLEHTRSDRAEEHKGFLVVDTKTLRFKRMELHRPRFVTIKVGDELTDVKGNFVDVTYERADDALEQTLAQLKELGARGINPIPLAKAKVVMQRRLNVSPTLSPHKVLRRYVRHKRRDAKKQGLDRGALLRLGLALVRSVD